MARINGPIATPAAEPAIEAQDSARQFTTTATIGGATREPLPASQTILAMSSLTISAQPGTHHLTLTAPNFTDPTHVTFPASTGDPLEIVVGQRGRDGQLRKGTACIYPAIACTSPKMHRKPLVDQECCAESPLSPEFTAGEVHGRRPNTAHSPFPGVAVCNADV